MASENNFPTWKRLHDLKEGESKLMLIRKNNQFVVRVGGLHCEGEIIVFGEKDYEPVAFCDMPSSLGLMSSIEIVKPEPDVWVLFAGEMDGPHDIRFKHGAWNGEKAIVVGASWLPLFWMDLPLPPDGLEKFYSELSKAGKALADDCDIVQDTGYACWFGSFLDGMSGSSAFDEDMSYAD